MFLTHHISDDEIVPTNIVQVDLECKRKIVRNKVVIEILFGKMKLLINIKSIFNCLLTILVPNMLL
jgi:hypothetical protein